MSNSRREKERKGERGREGGWLWWADVGRATSCLLGKGGKVLLVPSQSVTLGDTVKK